jgi:hypothetical protein
LHYPVEVKAVWLTVALLGLCAEAAAAPICISANIPTNVDFHLTFIEGPVFAESFGEYQPVLSETDLSDDLPDGDILAKTLSGDTYLRTSEPPAGVLAIAGVALFGIFEMLRRMLRYGRGQKTSGRRRRIRTYLRKMA